MSNPHASEHILQRQAKLAKLMAENGWDAVALNAGPSQTYYTGLHFHIMERPAVVVITAKGALAMVLPGFESGKTEGLGFEMRTFTYGEDPAEWQKTFNEAAKALGPLKRIGVEDLRMRVMELRYMEGAYPEASFERAEPLIAKMRMTKDAGEVAAMQRATEIAEAALAATIKHVKIGMTEKEMASYLIQQLYANGSDPELPFMPIVATGPNSANPHATVSDTKIQKGDLLLFDWGASYQGYLSDLTRTFAIGEVSEEFKRIYNVVKLANEVGCGTAKPGLPCSAVDDATREVIDDSGFGQYFTHRTGHGLGMEPHEEPYMRAGNSLKLEEGMSFTVEPGIYLDGRGGVRIEDNVVVTKDGAKVLSSFPRELQIIG
jgi:Xaa-Pro dipeptidase